MRAIREPVETADRRIADDALAVMVDGTRGYPFLIQLVGAQTWRLHPAVLEISMEDAQVGVANALRRLGSLIYEPALADASAIDKSFLLAVTSLTAEAASFFSRSLVGCEKGQSSPEDVAGGVLVGLGDMPAGPTAEHRLADTAARSTASMPPPFSRGALFPKVSRTRRDSLPPYKVGPRRG